MSVQSPYRIDVFHINIGVGDSTLIIVTNQLVDTDGVTSAVLIDGGDVQAYQFRLKQALLDISKIPTFNNLTLKAIVVTHYDSDHLVGIYDLLKDLASEKSTIRSIFPAAWDEVGNDTRVRIYDDGLYTNSGNDAPTGTKSVYNKYIKLVGGIVQYPIKKPVPVGTKRLVSEEVINETIQPNRILNKYIRRLTDSGTSYTMPATASPTAIYLGREVIWGDGHNIDSTLIQLKDDEKFVVSDVRIDAIGGVAELRKSHNIPQSLPMLFCVAMHFEPLAGESQKAYTVDKISGVTIKNQRSMAFMLANANNNIVHYLGGDVTDNIEKGITTWKNTSSNEMDALPFMKWSHHGATNSTPLELIGALKPSFGIVSAGQDQLSYCHPSWQNIYTWSKLVPFSFSIIPTCYPCYIGQSWTSNIRETTANKDAIYAKFKDIKGFTDGINKQIADNPGSIFLPSAQKIIEDINKIDPGIQGENLRAEIQKIWAIFADPNSENYLAVTPDRVEQGFIQYQHLTFGFDANGTPYYGRSCKTKRGKGLRTSAKKTITTAILPTSDLMKDNLANAFARLSMSTSSIDTIIIYSSFYTTLETTDGGVVLGSCYFDTFVGSLPSRI
jgi:beta-lactamase superfamily II metal-dependent hydrolase